jgi:hypothetical protein
VREQGGPEAGARSGGPEADARCGGAGGRGALLRAYFSPPPSRRRGLHGGLEVGPVEQEAELELGRGSRSGCWLKEE